MRCATAHDITDTRAGVAGVEVRLPELELSFDAHLLPAFPTRTSAVERRHAHRDARRLRRWARRHLAY